MEKELNKEQIIKDLECCANEWYCGLCEFTKKECALIKKSALALINSQEQKIKGLEQCLEHERASFMETFGEYGEKCDRLTEENERLRAEDEKWREMWVDNQRKWEEAYNKLEGENEKLINEKKLVIEQCDKAMESQLQMYKNNLKHFEECYEKKIDMYMETTGLKQIKADTVNHFAERLRAEMSFGRYIQADQIDQIAKELLEGKK